MSLQEVTRGLAQPRAKTPTPWLVSYSPSLVVGFSFVYFARRMFALISRFAVNIFFSDQWKFNDATLFEKHSMWQIFTWQHGWHRQGVGGLFSALVDPRIYWDSRIQAFLMGTIILVSALCALGLKRRLFGGLSVFDALIPALLFTPAQYESLLVIPNYSQGAFPLLLLILFCFAWTCRGNMVRYPLILVINFLAIYTGFGLFLGCLTPVLLILDYRATPGEERARARYLIASVALAVGSIASFFLGFSFKLLNDFLCPAQPSSLIRSYASYTAIMYAGPFGIAGVGLNVKIAGVLVEIGVLGVLSVTVWKLLRRTPRQLDPQSRQRHGVVALLILLSLVLCVNAAHGRACFPLWTATASRYVICVLPGFFGLYFGLLEIGHPLVRRLLATGLAVALVAAAFHVSMNVSYFPDIKRRWRNCYLQLEDAPRCDQIVGFSYTQTPKGAHIEEKLRYLKNARQNLYSNLE